MNFLIFLDFDGVLHAHWGPESERFYFMPRFEAVLRDFPNVQVVIASSWGLRQNLETLRSYFSPDIQARVIGISKFTEEQAVTYYGRRHRSRAAERFLEAHGFNDRPWVALDDEPSFWDPGDPVIVCEGGFRSEEETRLRMVLGGEMPATSLALGRMYHLIHVFQDPSKVRLFFLKHYTGDDDEIGVNEWFKQACLADLEFYESLIGEQKGVAP